MDHIERDQGGSLGECPVLPVDVEHESDYAYVLGMYLGDGHLARLRRTWVLRIYLDVTQPEIADRCVVVGDRIYPAYNFTNRSKDILELFLWTRQLLGVHFTTPTKYAVSIARRPDVARLDVEIGPEG